MADVHLPRSATVASEQRRTVLRTIADTVPRAAGDDCVRVGVDGVDGVGKTHLADELATVLRARGRAVVRISADDFHDVREIRHRRGRWSPEGFWLDSYNYERLCADVLDPLGPGGDRRYRWAAHDLDTDAEVQPPLEVAPPGAVLVLDGLFLHRDALAGHWDLSIWLDAPFGVTAARMAARDGTDADPAHPSVARYVEGQRLYLAARDPASRAHVVVDNSDLEHPRIQLVRPLDRAGR